MKRIYMTLGLIAAAATGVMAQTAKTIDLGIRLLSPANNTTRANFNNGDTLLLVIELSNNGTADVTTTDTIKAPLQLQLMGNNTQYSELGFPPMNLAAGTKDTFNYPIIKNNTTLPNDTKFCTWMTVYGYAQDLLFFNDAGFDAQAYLDAQSLADIKGAFSGNNLAELTYQTGTGANNLCSGGVGIIEFGGDSKVALNVYPNPVMDNLNFDFNLDKAANAVVRITDIAGRTVKTQDLGKVKAGDHKFSINVSNLNSGLYMVEVSAEGKRFVSKFNRK